MNRKERRLANKKNKTKIATPGIVADEVSRLLSEAAHYYQAGKYITVEACLKEVIKLQPDNIIAMNNLSGIMIQQGRHHDALSLLEKLVEQQPENAMLFYNLGVLYKDLKRPEDAVNAYLRAEQLDPDDPRIHINLSAILKQLDRLDEAREYCATAIKLAPDSVSARTNMGVILCELEQLDEALIFLNNTLVDFPNCAAAYATKGLILTKMEQVEEATDAYEQSLGLDPDCSETYYNYGLMLEKAYRHDEAIVQFERSIQLDPGMACAYNGKGNCLKEQGRIAEALACYDQVIEREANHAKAHFNKGIALLLLGKFAEGWREYLWRYKLPLESCPPYNFPRPHWDGQDFNGKTLLLHAEQGLGDTIQFLRYLPLVKARGTQIIIQCQQPLKELIEENCDVLGVYHRRETLPDFDLHCPLMSLPGFFGTRQHNVPSPSGYLQTSAEVGFRKPERFSIGLVWQGSIRNHVDDRRSIQLEDLQPLSELDNIELVSLQFDDPKNQLEKINWRDKVTECPEWIVGMRNTAAVIDKLDMVITVDTSIAHLAAALGKPVWVLLPIVPDWRWLMQGDSSYWYDTIKLFRQTERGNWQSVIKQICVELQSLQSKPSFQLAS